MAERSWGKLVAIGIPISWAWFILLGVRWDIYYALFIVIALTLILGTLTSIIDSPGRRGR